MLARSDIPLGIGLDFLAKAGVRGAFFVPTETGMKKSIIDATAPVRDLLLQLGLHDYQLQRQGEKAQIKVGVVTSRGIDTRTLSLYRPNTKKGDPRLWVSRLGSVAAPGNLLVLFGAVGGPLYALNLSDKILRASALDPSSELSSLLREVRQDDFSDVARELRDKLQEISRRGYIDSLRDGSTGIGFTLETLLGIDANSSKAPDYKGIELKTQRAGAMVRSTLFSQVPDWGSSRIGSYPSFLDKYGYQDTEGDRKALYITLSSKPYKIRDGNGSLLALRVPEDEAKLYVDEIVTSGEREWQLQWQMAFLKERLNQKHPETFWVGADVEMHDVRESFHYTTVKHTQSPFTHQLPTLLGAGVITLDVTAHRSNQTGVYRDHGMLFKIQKKDFGLLFPPLRNYDLVTGHESISA